MSLSMKLKLTNGGSLNFRAVTRKSYLQSMMHVQGLLSLSCIINYSYPSSAGQSHALHVDTNYEVHLVNVWRL